VNFRTKVDAKKLTAERKLVTQYQYCGR